MANSIVISRIQHRRGRRENLPQPLRIGEIALTSDTSQVWIGTDPELATPGVKVYADKSIATAQGIADTNIVEAKFTGDFTSASFTSLYTDLLASSVVALDDPAEGSEEILWDDTYRGIILTISVDAAGTSYTTGDAVTALSSTGTGFVGTVVDDGGGGIQSIAITNGGYGYVAATTTFTIANGSSGAISVASSDIHGYSVYIAADTANHAGNTVANIVSEVAATAIGTAIGISSAALGGSYGGLFGSGFLATFDHVAAAHIADLTNVLDGSTTGLVYTNLNLEVGSGAGGGLGTIPYEAAFYFSGIVLTASWLYSRFIFTSDITFKTTATSYAYAAVAPTGGTSFEIQKNGVSFGSISFAGASNTGVVAVGADTSFTAGDQLSIVGPVTPDGTIDQIAITLLGELTL